VTPQRWLSFPSEGDSSSATGEAVEREAARQWRKECRYEATYANLFVPPPAPPAAESVADTPSSPPPSSSQQLWAIPVIWHQPETVPATTTTTTTILTSTPQQ